MNTLFDGRLDAGLAMKDLLDQVLQAKPTGISFLRISDPDQIIDGRIFFLDGKHVIGALLFPSLTCGYASLKSLLEVKLGTYALVLPEAEDKLTIDHSLNIDLQALRERLDNLPDEPVNLFDQEYLLDKVFSAEADLANHSQTSQAITKPLGLSEIGSLAETHLNQDWLAPANPSDVSEHSLLADISQLINNKLKNAYLRGSRPARQQSRQMANDRPPNYMLAQLSTSLPQAIYITAVVLAAIWLWHWYSHVGNNHHQLPKNFLSSPNQPYSDVSSNRVHIKNSVPSKRRI